jgi:hypothetical protein
MLADQTCCGSDTGAIVGARCLAWWLLCLATFDGDGADGPDLGCWRARLFAGHEPRRHETDNGEELEAHAIPSAIPYR